MVNITRTGSSKRTTEQTPRNASGSMWEYTATWGQYGAWRHQESLAETEDGVIWVGIHSFSPWKQQPGISFEGGATPPMISYVD